MSSLLTPVWILSFCFLCAKSHYPSLPRGRTTVSDVWGSKEFRLGIAKVRTQLLQGPVQGKSSHLFMTNTVLGLSNSDVVLEGRREKDAAALDGAWLQKCLLHVLILLPPGPSILKLNQTWPGVCLDFGSGVLNLGVHLLLACDYRLQTASIPTCRSFVPSFRHPC